MDMTDRKVSTSPLKLPGQEYCNTMAFEIMFTVVASCGIANDLDAETRKTLLGVARYQCEISVLEITRKRHFSQFNQPRPVIIDNYTSIPLSHHPVVFLDSEQSDERIYFTMMGVFFFLSVYSITSRNNTSISNFGGGFLWQSENPWCIIEVEILSIISGLSSREADYTVSALSTDAVLKPGSGTVLVYTFPFAQPEVCILFLKSPLVTTPWPWMQSYRARLLVQNSEVFDTNICSVVIRKHAFTHI
ncbi:hypothetical protein AGLY_006477 [Aphis glycines]|uniref:Uncharacterized protein n=1 Tax=Aphis glycines TaxID=307491 RepID=A0A6G0TR96_APHGL|nr:hypothetical protein AGLY_006477 [Aphis glycines]